MTRLVQDLFGNLDRYCLAALKSLTASLEGDQLSVKADCANQACPVRKIAIFDNFDVGNEVPES